MSSRMGTIVLMGSGELTATMVEVHKKMLARLPEPTQAVFLDTPAGFQLNVDEISRKAVEYFRVHIQKPLKVASYKSTETATALEAETAFQELRNANFVLFGPGSPTYAIDQLSGTPIPDILKKVVQTGGCLVAASAAALAINRHTLPVYEIYKVGQKVHWVEGLDILSSLGFHPVVVPHWNNAEGGTHDTRFCFMGEPRFQQLEALLPEDVTVLGIDEHTACIVDLESQHIEIQGIGGVAIRRRGREIKFGKGEQIPFDALVKDLHFKEWRPKDPDKNGQTQDYGAPKGTLIDHLSVIKASFEKGLANRDQKEATSALLELDTTIWQAQTNLEDEERISQAREILRDSIVLLGSELNLSHHRLKKYLAPLVEPMLRLRARFRKEQKWSEADGIRDILLQADIFVEDTPDGFRWGIIDKE